MSISLLLNPAFIHPLFNGDKNYPRTGVKPEFFYTKDSTHSLTLQIEVNPKFKILKSSRAIHYNVCKCCAWFSTSSSNNFNFRDFGDYGKREDLGAKEIDGSVINNGGCGDGQWNNGGGGGGRGGNNNGNGGGGVGENGGWSGVKWLCWLLLEAGKNLYFQFAPPISAVISRMIISSIEDMVGSMVESELESILMSLLGAILLPIFVLPFVAFAGFMAAMEVMAYWVAIGLLACVLALLFLFWKISQHLSL